MAKKAQKLKPDIILKNYWNDNERFADFFNAVLFGGEEVIRPEELESVYTEASAVFEHRKHAEGAKASREKVFRARSTACASWDGESGAHTLCHAYVHYGV